MDLSVKFRTLSSCQWLTITSLQKDRSYNIEWAENVRTPFGERILLTLTDSPYTCVKILLPSAYGDLFTEDDLNAIKEKNVFLALVYRGNSPVTDSYILEIY